MKFDFTPVFYGFAISMVLLYALYKDMTKLPPEGFIHLSFAFPTKEIQLDEYLCDIESDPVRSRADCKISGQTGILKITDVKGAEQYFLLEDIEGTPNKTIRIERSTISSDIPIISLQPGPKFEFEPGPEPSR